MPFPLSGLRMAKSFDNALKIRILLRSVKYCFKSRSKQLYVKDLKAFLTLSFKYPVKFHLSKHTSKHPCYLSKQPLWKAFAQVQSKVLTRSVSLTFSKRSSNFASILHAMLCLLILCKLQNIKP